MTTTAPTLPPTDAGAAKNKGKASTAEAPGKGQVKKSTGKQSAAKAAKSATKPANSSKKSSATTGKRGAGTSIGTSGGKSERLRPGQLDGLVLGFMRQHKDELPLTPGKIAAQINRSSGAVGNCLERLSKTNDVRRVADKPRKYGLPKVR